MTSIAETGQETGQAAALRDEFFGWQCRVRQIAMRKNEGQPDEAFMPSVTLRGETAPMGSIITIICKTSAFSQTPEMRHMVNRTHDRAERRDKAIQFFSSTYYQRPKEFADTLMATFVPHSTGANAIMNANECTLRHRAYGQCFDIYCTAHRLLRDDPLYQATWWHNLLFNPGLHPDTIIIGFKPDWTRSSMRIEGG